MDWEPAAVATVEQLAQQLAGDPIVKCDQLQLLDRSTYEKLESVRRAHPGGLPSPRWAGRDRGLDRGNSPATVGPDSFAQSEATALCASTAVGKDVQAVRGPDWAIIATSPKLAERAASATGGEALTPAC